VNLWSHFDIDGRRTAHHEPGRGLANSLNSRFGMPHPSMRNVLDRLQKCQFEVQCRGLQLAAGRPPAHRSPIYVQLDAKIERSKVTLSMHMAYIFACIFPHPDA
jgi:hypothetical protein